MGILRDKIFYRTLIDTLNDLRRELCTKYKPKKGDRFFTNGITYELSSGRLLPDGVEFEISSKIPLEIFDKKGLNEKYFKDVKKLMMSKPKKPADVKMENIIHSTNVSEIKERDYVKCIFSYGANELYNDSEVNEIVGKVQAKKMQLPDIKDITTLPGKVVIYLMRENIRKFAYTNILDLIKSNEEVMKKYKSSKAAAG